MRRFPLDDSPVRAAETRALIDLPRARALELGRAAHAFLLDPRYTAPNGTIVDLASRLRAERAGALSLPPDAPLPTEPAPRRAETVVRVVNAPTLAVAAALRAEGRAPWVLNFANGLVPGGGYLDGSRAQEESLCYASTLVGALEGDPFYAHHAQRGDLHASDWVIVSEATVYRDLHYRLLDAPWTMTVITAAAPVAAPDDRDPGDGRAPRARASALMASRVERVIAVAAALGAQDLVLGAWGCGAFANDPVAVSSAFEASLRARDGVFDEVAFAIADWSPERRFLAPFAARFSA